MNIQTVFQAGNAQVIAIPKHIADETGFKVGQKIVVDVLPGEEGLIIKKAPAKKTKKTASSTEFKRWLADVLKEDAEILEELSVR